MSISSVSTMNKYLLTHNGIYVAPITYINKGTVIFPDQFGDAVTKLNNTTVNDCYFNFDVVDTVKPYVNKTGYQLFTSSNQIWSGQPNIGQSMFNGDALFWSPNYFDTNISPPYYYNGVSQGQYLQNTYTSTGNYVGGGVGYYITTVFKRIGTTDSSVDGEYFQIKFPFKVKISEFQIMCRAGAQNRCIKDIVVLGSDDGVIWTYIGYYNYTAYTNSVAQVRQVNTSEIYTYLRFCVQHTMGNVSLNVGKVKMTVAVYEQV